MKKIIVIIIFVFLFLPGGIYSQQPAKTVYYVIRASNVTATDIVKAYPMYIEIGKDFSELDISIIFTSPEIINELKERKQIIFFSEYVPGFFKKQLPNKYFKIIEDGSKNEIFTGEDWAYKKVQTESFIRAGLTGKGIVVVYMDTGINNINHKTIKGKIERWYDWTKEIKGIYDDLFFYWGRSHGQETLSVATKIMPDVKVYFHKIHSAPNGANYFEDVLEAFNQIALDKSTDNRPFVVNMSFCLVGDYEIFDVEYADLITLTDQCLKKITQKYPDVYFIASAGNNASFEEAPGRPNQYPAGSDYVISVGAFNERNEIATFPVGEVNYYSALGGDVWAPGHNVLVADGRKDQDAAMRKSMGTSIATPFVTAEVVAICEFAIKNKINLNQKLVFDLVNASVDKETTIVVFHDKDKEGKKIIHINLINFKKLVTNLEKLAPKSPSS